MRRHPVVLGLVLLMAIGVLLYLVFYRAGAEYASPGHKSFSLKDKIGVVPVEGVIADSIKISEDIDAFATDNSIVAVVIRVDSPGGGVAASQEIYEAIQTLKKKKKVVVSMGSVAASGGLLIACAADKIVANPGTITGSISAIMQFANLEDLFKKIGVKSSVIKSGQYKDIGSPMREMTPEERVIIQELVDDIYNQFIDVIVRDRQITREQVMAIGDGRVFSGRKAKEYGLVDELGDLARAAKLASELSGGKGEYDLVYPQKKRDSFLDYMFESAASQFSRAVMQKAEKSLGGVSYIYIP